MNELVYGVHPVQSLLEMHPEQILKIHVIRKPWSSRFALLVRQINKYDICLEKHDRLWFDHNVKNSLHQGVIAEVSKISSLTKEDLLKFLMICNTVPLLLVLDGIIDPHNLGACLRSAESAGVNMIIVPKNRSARINATVRKVSSGAADRVSCIQVTNLSRILKLLREHGVWIVGTVIKSDFSIFNAKLKGPLALVMGSEEFGLRRLTKKYCDELVNIPLAGSISSLNVSVATGICLFEALRQREYQK